MIDTKSMQETKAGVLPEFWPQAPLPVIARAWWIPWPVAVLLVPLLWIMPKRMGPHFAAVRWPGVIIGHLFWTLYGIGCIDLAYWAPHYGWVAWLTGRSPGQANPALWPPPGAWDIFRAPLALEAVWLSQTIGGIEHYLLAWGAVLGCELGVAAMGLLLMPYVTVGERTTRLVARCIKLTMWATTSAVVLGLALQGVVLAWPESPRLPAIVTLICCGYAIWFLWTWWRSGLRYWGPAEGYAWTGRRPSCEQCGYTLTGLMPGDRCPECGQAVADSMPARRGLTPYAAAHGLDRIPALFVTAFRVVTKRSFSEQVAVHSGHEDAKSFAILMCLLAAGVTAVLAAPMVTLPWCSQKHVRLDSAVAMLAAAFLVPCVAVFIANLAVHSVVILCASAIARRPLPPQAAIVFLHSAWLLLLGPATALGLLACLMITEAGSAGGGALSWMAVVIAATVVFAVIVTKAAASLFKTMHQTRFANA